MASIYDEEPTWTWPDQRQVPDDVRQRNSGPSSTGPSGRSGRSSPRGSTTTKGRGSTTQESSQDQRPKKTYSPRTCRICLETVLPSFESASENLPSIFSPSPSVQYVSPEAGRLLRPCKCKGSSRYVHEGCLQAWRHADPGYGKRNYWECPTCGFRYRLERIRWGAWISSTSTQISLTISILCLTMFLLGFVADPIINLYVDPYNTILSAPYSRLGGSIDPRRAFEAADDELTTWTEHFLKGLASLGLLSFVKVLFAMSPWQWWNLRSSGLMGGGSGGRAGASGRDRLASISWIVVLVGVGTFIWGVYKGVRAWSRRWLEKAGERVIDVQMETDDDDDDDDDADNDNDIHADDGPHFSPCSSAANPAMSSPNEGRKAQ